MLTAASRKLAEAVELLAAAGEERLAAHVEDLIHQIELLEDQTSHNKLQR
jgi:hypothetical protein